MMMARNPLFIVFSLILAVFLWGGNNVGVKILVREWPPIWVGSTRFALAGLLMLALLRWTRWLGETSPHTPALRRELWTRGGLSLACYVACFNWALHYTSASHVALHLGASPVWALIWEWRRGQPDAAKRLIASGLALSGILVLFWPVLGSGGSTLIGEVLAFTSSILWTNYGRQCRHLGQTFKGAELSAQTMWRAGLLLLPLGFLEPQRVHWDLRLASIQAYCILFGAILAFALWTNALRHWKTSEVYLFNNLIPLSTMAWAHLILAEPITPTFGLAMVLIVSGVVLGQTDWQALLGRRWFPAD